MPFPWKYLSITHGASLSKDGDLLAMIVSDWRSGRYYYLYITSLKEGWAKLLRAEEYLEIQWGD
jgi:hypothetical protein